MTTRRLRCSHVVTPAGVLRDGMVIIDGEQITAVRSFDPEDQFALAELTPIEVIDGWVVPGFVDTHIHGSGGHDLAGTDVDAARSVIDFVRRRGTAHLFGSLVTARIDTLEDQLRTLVPLLDSGELAGIHLEGPFLSYGKRGAHTPELLRNPDPESVDRLLTAADGRLSMITIAPELPGALDAIARFTAAGTAVAIGHTEGDDRVTRAALDAGASVATHLFNGMPSIHHREPGPVPVLLTDERVLVELVCDGVHLHPEVIKMAVAAAGPERVALITDAMIATGMADGDYTLGRLQVVVADGVARLRTPDGSPGSIAGSTLTMAAAFAFCVQQAGLSIADVATMAATTPAARHGLRSIGALAAGRRADLAVVDDQGNLQRLMYGGSWQDDQHQDQHQDHQREGA
ncbi:MAG: N-acetylglucosamine-6-phosphate deacetylase [Microlunatus sp.]|nr:N-acetylglucosamine-6-phosphate deacetylase [Microlunatus sp.]